MANETREITRAYRVALDPTESQRQRLASHAGAARKAYNHRLEDLIADHARFVADRAQATYLPELDHLVPSPDLPPAERRTAEKLQLEAAGKIVAASAVSPAMRAYRQETAWLTYADFAHMTPLGARQQAAKKMKRDHGAPPTSPYATPVSASLDSFKAIYPWADENNRYALANGMAAADTAFANWKASLTGARKGRPMGYPRFHGKGRGTDSFTLNHDVSKPSLRPDGYRRFVLPEKITGVRGGSIRLHGNVRHLTRRINRGTARIQSVTITRGGRYWFLSILATETIIVPAGGTKRAHQGGPVGVDVGVSHLAALSTGELVPNPRHVRGAERRLTRAQRQLARASWIRESDGALVSAQDRRRGVRYEPTKGRARASARVARIHADIAASRAGTIHRLTKRLTTEHHLVAIEDLNVSGMTRSAAGTLDAPGRNVRAKSGLNRSILDASFGEFRRQLTYKTAWYGSELVVIDRFAPTSQTCATCGARAKLTLAVRVYHCTSCGAREDRDVNAARNILNLATRDVMHDDASGEGSRKTPVESGLAPDPVRPPGHSMKREGQDPRAPATPPGEPGGHPPQTGAA